MINLRLIETNFDEFNKKLKAKKVDDGVLSELLDTYDALKKAKSQLKFTKYPKFKEQRVRNPR